MAGSPRPKGQIRRVPVPSRHLAPAPAAAPAPAPAHISFTTTSPPAITQSQTQTQSSSRPLMQTDVIVRGQYLPRAPIPLVSTNSWQPLPSYSIRGDEYDHHAQTDHNYTPHLIRMEPESQNQHFNLSPQLEEDIKLAVLASMPSPDHPVPVKKRKTVVHRKNIRWTSLSICLILIIGEIPVTVLFGFDFATLFAYILATLLALWDGWRLFRLRQKFDDERISGWHVALEIAYVSAIVAVTVVVSVWVSNQAQTEYYYQDYETIFESESFWRGIAVAILFLILFILHSVLLIITVVEKWTKPAYQHVVLPTDTQSYQPPPIVVQFTSTCPTCHNTVDIRTGADENHHQAAIGDSQPQGVAPAFVVQQKDMTYSQESLQDHEFYGPGGRARGKDGNLQRVM
ncbi:hypothetical protein GGS24DRAFT_208112 [Hypoxylon argillaceum]|nr:hypothetical protein GGS24DRAFT_208112 [Hypoxylon argillaceum]